MQNLLPQRFQLLGFDQDPFLACKKREKKSDLLGKNQTDQQNLRLKGKWENGRKKRFWCEPMWRFEEKIRKIENV